MLHIYFRCKSSVTPAMLAPTNQWPGGLALRTTADNVSDAILESRGDGNGTQREALRTGCTKNKLLLSTYYSRP